MEKEFKIWDRRNLRMLDGNDWIEKLNVLTTVNLNELFQRKNLLFLQYTGKKDKNGNTGWFLQQKSAQGKFLDVTDDGYSNIKFLSDALGYPKPQLPK